ncbi:MULTISPECIES: hypothetical protein [Undibacterium]|uniref:Uncharacterized protein n=2 Tax=Undibacterium TaxID=401469 RepID=A0A941DCT7_9BURK|nr:MULTISPECIES: hypothetical protein [Undibacterium]MBR7745736.1 hypothetical protein [Undibacterium baiyunense]GGX09787.1 hypothetical protein GCM10011282_15030 [Undibacterium macrobrachii]
MPGCRKRKCLNKFRRPMRRRDLLTRMLVDLGMTYAESFGGLKAIAFLREKNVPEPVITRVIGNDYPLY